MKESKIKIERKLFEEWAKDKGYCLDMIGQEYESYKTNDAWFAWLARAELD